jgi:hypothetical protein
VTRLGGDLGPAGGWSGALVAVAAALVVDLLLAAGAGGDLDAPARRRPPGWDLEIGRPLATLEGARTACRHRLGGDRGGGGAGAAVEFAGARPRRPSRTQELGLLG